MPPGPQQRQIQIFQSFKKITNSKFVEMQFKLSFYSIKNQVAEIAFTTTAIIVTATTTTRWVKK